MNKRSIIMEHYQNPLNREIPQDTNYIKINTLNESCIDNIDLFLLSENDKIKDIKFEGEACAISISSTSIMIKNLVDKTFEDALVYINNFENMINNKPYDKEIMKEAIVYDDVKGNRKSCALLPYIGIKKYLEEQFKLM